MKWRIVVSRKSGVIRRIRFGAKPVGRIRRDLMKGQNCAARLEEWRKYDICPAASQSREACLDQMCDGAVHAPATIRTSRGFDSNADDYGVTRTGTTGTSSARSVHVTVRTRASASRPAIKLTGSLLQQPFRHAPGCRSWPGFATERRMVEIDCSLGAAAIRTTSRSETSKPRNVPGFCHVGSALLWGD